MPCFGRQPHQASSFKFQAPSFVQPIPSSASMQNEARRSSIKQGVRFYHLNRAVIGQRNPILDSASGADLQLLTDERCPLRIAFVRETDSNQRHKNNNHHSLYINLKPILNQIVINN